jgi:hypothetical protein
VRRRMLPPLRGVADNSAFVDQPANFAPLGSVRNARIFRRPGGRPQMGKRGGLARLFSTAAGGGSPVRDLGVIDRAAGTTYQVGTARAVDGGISLEAGPLLGQVWFLDTDRGMFRSFNETYPDIDGDGSPASGNYQPAALSWHPSSVNCAICSIVLKDYGGATGIQTISFVRLLNTATGATVWSTEIEDKDPGGSVPTTPIPLYANSVRVFNTFTFVCVAKYVYVLRTSDGVYIKRVAMADWSWEAMDCRVRTDGTLAVLYQGNPAIGGPILNLNYVHGSYFRSGIALYTVNSDTTVNGTPLTGAQFGVKKAASYTYYEDHVHFRFSEQSPRAPHGHVPYCMDIANDGSLLIGHTNQGFGPTTAFTPNGLVPYRTVTKITKGTTPALAAIAWEADTESGLYNWLGTNWFNDIPIDASGLTLGAPRGGPEPSVNAIGVNAAGNVFCGGKRANGFSVTALRGTDGAILWRADTGGVINQHCLVPDPVSGLIVVGGERTSTWTGSGGADALLWWVDPATGEFVDAFDLAEALDVYGLAPWVFGLDVSNDGKVAFATSPVA